MKRPSKKPTPRNQFTGIRTYVLEAELARRGSLAYARNVNREYRAIASRAHLTKEKV